MEEISTSFCFICLLHLANEQGLKLEANPDGTLPTVGENLMGGEGLSAPQKIVGNLWDLKVCWIFAFDWRARWQASTNRCIGIHMLHSLHNLNRMVLVHLTSSSCHGGSQERDIFVFSSLLLWYGCMWSLHGFFASFASYCISTLAFVCYYSYRFMHCCTGSNTSII